MSSEPPFDMSVFTSALSQTVEFEVAGTTMKINGLMPSKDARELARMIVGACDVAEGQLLTDEALSFLAGGTRGKGTPA